MADSGNVGVQHQLTITKALFGWFVTGRQNEYNNGWKVSFSLAPQRKQRYAKALRYRIGRASSFDFYKKTGVQKLIKSLHRWLINKYIDVVNLHGSPLYMSGAAILDWRDEASGVA